MIYAKPRICIVHPLLRAREYQGRPQFDQLCSWWREGGVGVCALVGIGGAGKTALADRFLRVLPGVTPDEPGLKKKADLPTPAGVFVFSFYDAPNPDKLFSELSAWLIPESEVAGARSCSFSQLLPLLGKIEPVLLILDGLEKVQDEGGRGGHFGQIEDARLRDFILRVADGLLGRLSVIITTRFPLYEPLAQRSPFYQSIPVETLEPDAAVSLLRARGVAGGSRDDLLRLAKSQGFHALTLDLLGGYIAHFHGGDITSLPPDQAREFDEEEEQQQTEPDLWNLRTQERRFARLAERYRETLSQRDPAALAVLQRVCLFRMGVDVATLASIFLRRRLFDTSRLRISGVRLYRLSERDLRGKLKILTHMRLLESTSYRSGSAEVYTAHPAIRDGFVQSLNPDTVRRGHEAACKNLESVLVSRPGEKYPTDPGILDILEEIIYHTIESGRLESAWDIYWDRMGGYRNLGWRLAAYDRGERICRAIGGDVQKIVVSRRLPREKLTILINEWALFLSDLGSLAAASTCCESFVDQSLGAQDWLNASIGRQNLGLMNLSAGRPRLALEASVEAVHLAERANTSRHALASAYAQVGHIKASMGNLQGAFADFRTARDLQNKLERRDYPLYSNRGAWHALALLRLGKHDKAEYILNMSDQICTEATRTKFHQDYASHSLLLSELALLRGDISEAISLLEQAQEWAFARSAQELICWAAVTRSRISLTRVESDEGLLAEEASVALGSIEEGLHIARNCGFGIHFIDLMVLRARAQILIGDDEGAIVSAKTALFGLAAPSRQVGVYDAPPLDETSPEEWRGIFPARASGLPEILAATHKDCCYRWGEADARHTLAEALLFKAARLLGRERFTPQEKLPEIVANLTRRGGEEIESCWRLRISMGDPRAQEVELSLERLREGVLIKGRLPSQLLPDPSLKEPLVPGRGSRQGIDVFLSHNSKDLPAVLLLAEALKARGIRLWLDSWELVPGRPWQEAVEDAIRVARTVAILVGRDGLGPWTIPEMRGALVESVRRRIPVIPVLLPDAPTEPALPLFLERYTWVDLREGLSTDGLDRLVWGITGVRPAGVSDDE